jgi:hypothetical protein
MTLFSREEDAMPATPCHVPQLTITITPKEVGEIAGFVTDSGGVLPENFQPAAWLEANQADLAIVATEAVTNVVAELPTPSKAA